MLFSNLAQDLDPKGPKDFGTGSRSLHIQGGLETIFSEKMYYHKWSIQSNSVIKSNKLILL